MNNYESIDAYLTGSMSPEDQANFESKMTQDKELSREVAFQQDIIEGIKLQRSAELKSFLNTIEVPTQLVSTTKVSLGKVVGLIALAGVLAYGIYYYTLPEDPVNETREIPLVEEPGLPPTQESVIAEDVPEKASEAQTEEDSNTDEVISEQPTTLERKKKPVQNNTQNEPQVVKPSVTDFGVDNTKDEVDMSIPDAGLSQNTVKEDDSGITIIVDNSKRKYSFHYQFKDEKLFLFGSFNDGLYEILEFNTDSGSSLYLYYQNKYYALNDNSDKIEKLEPVEDEPLVDKLEKSRLEF